MKWLAVDQYSGLFFIMGFVFLFFSILFFIIFRIPGIFFYLSGSRQKKNIKILRKKREEEKKRGFSLQGKIDMEYLRKRSEEKQEEQRRILEQAPWKQEGEATAKLLTPEDNYTGQETGQLLTRNAAPTEASGETVKIPKLYSESNSERGFPKIRISAVLRQAKGKEGTASCVCDFIRDGIRVLKIFL